MKENDRQDLAAWLKENRQAIRQVRNPSGDVKQLVKLIRSAHTIAKEKL